MTHTEAKAHPKRLADIKVSSERTPLGQCARETEFTARPPAARPARRHGHAARRALHRPRRALRRLPLPPPPPLPPLLPPAFPRRRPPPPSGSSGRPRPRRAAARRPCPARRPGVAGAQVWPRHVPQDGHLRRGGGVVAVRGEDVPQGARRPVREPAGGGECRGHHVQLPEHGVRQLRCQVEADAEACQRAPARRPRARRLGGGAPRRGRPAAARHGGGVRRGPPRRHPGGARLRSRQHRRPDHRQQAGVRRAGRRVQQLQRHDRVAADGRGAVQHQRLRAGAGEAGPAGGPGQAAANPQPVRHPHHQAARRPRRHRRRPSPRRPPRLRRQAPRRRRRRRRGWRDHHRGQHQGPHLRHVHGRDGHVVDHRGVGDGGDDQEPAGDGAGAGGDGPRRRPRPPPRGVRHRQPPLPPGRLQGGHAPPPLDAAQPPALLLRRVRRRRLPRPREHAAAHQHLRHRPRPVGVGGPAGVQAGAVHAGRRRREGGPARQLLRAHPLRRRKEDLRREARRHGVRPVLPGHAGALVRLAAPRRRGEARHVGDVRPRAAQGRPAPRPRHAAARAGRLRVTDGDDEDDAVYVIECVQLGSPSRSRRDGGDLMLRCLYVNIFSFVRFESKTQLRTQILQANAPELISSMICFIDPNVFCRDKLERAHGFLILGPI